jgi:asparagine synthase (glutamine-hydrolysing)
MCGIAGLQGKFPVETLQRMAAAMAHRGPDGEGLLYRPDVGLGFAHRRLAIIDLSHDADQPMTDQPSGLTLIFNGEIYNYRDLRDELVRDGHVFRTHSDTEVLLRLLVRDGTDALRRLNGIFALAVWDERRQELLLARDGLGVKPLYYATTPAGFLFASELKSLLQDPGVSRRLDPLAVASYMTYLWSPAPRTPLSSVLKLEPGMAMTVKDGRITKHWCHYELPGGNGHRSLSAADAVELVREAVATAVERQMVADVPVGAFLSGGLDSSAVVAFARQHGRERLQCFTIGYKGDAGGADGMTEDLPYAKRVAAHLDVDLHTVTVGPEMVDCLEKMIHHLDEPQADPAPLNALFISQLARENGIKVLLSGAGGDDIFTGYRRHYALTKEHWWSWLPKSARAALAGASTTLPAGSAFGRRLRKAFEYAALDGHARLASYFFWLPPGRMHQLLAPDLRAQVEAMQVMAPLREAIDAMPAEATDLDRMLRLEQRFFLADHNLNYTDKMSMAHGVEVRVPLLDPDLLALASSLPDNLKQHGNVGKWIFKKAMEPYLPHDVIYRPKTGFGAPLRRWLRNELRPMVDEMLSPAVLSRRGIFDPQAVSALVRDDREGRIDAAYSIFAILCMEIWCRLNLDRTPSDMIAARFPGCR